jgi:hypothetical protein
VREFRFSGQLIQTGQAGDRGALQVERERGQALPLIQTGQAGDRENFRLSVREVRLFN